MDGKLQPVNNQRTSLIPQEKALRDGFSSAFTLVDDVVLKNYITRLPDFSVVPLEKSAIANNLGKIRLFKITEMVYEQDESATYKFASVFNAVAATNSAIVTIIDSDGIKTDFYLGIRSLSEENSTQTSYTTLVNAMKGQFPGTQIENLKNKYDKAQANVEKITDSLQQHQVRLMKDSAMLDKMYEQNLNYFKELTMFILAGKKKLEETRNGKLAEMKNKAALSGLPEDAQAARDLDEKCSRFEKKLHDLELTRTIAMQTAPQIRLIQNNDTVMVEKIQTTIVNTIPLWKSQMVLALGIAHSAEAAQAQRQVTDITNELLRKNAETLHMATVETAKESERGIVDLETLQKTNADLIQTLDDVMRIQMEGRQKRQAAEMEMHRMEEELKRKLLEIR